MSNNPIQFADSNPSQEVAQYNPVSPVIAGDKAVTAANVCRDIVTKLAIKIQGKKYLPVEAWQAIANAMGFFISADEAKREYDPKGELIGYSAKGYVRDRQGVIIGTGEGFVGMDETKSWAKRAEYACRAMAQTRAQSRAGRSVFAFIVTMISSDLKTTPAEEMSHADEVFEEKLAPKKPTPSIPPKQFVKNLFDANKDKMVLPDIFHEAMAQLDVMSIDECREMYKELNAFINDELKKGVKNGQEKSNQEKSI